MDEQQNQPVQQSESNAMPAPQSQTTASTANQNLNAALTYLVGWITGLIFLLVEKENDFIRFHAAQSLLTFGALTVIAMIPLLGWLISTVLAPIGFVLWIVLMIMAYQGKRFKLPVIGDYAEQLKDKIGK